MSNESTYPSSSAEITTVFNARDPATTLLSVNMANITKLTNNNYIMWSRQIKALLKDMSSTALLITPSQFQLPRLLLMVRPHRIQLFHHGAVRIVFSIALSSVQSQFLFNRWSPVLLWRVKSGIYLPWCLALHRVVIFNSCDINLELVSREPKRSVSISDLSNQRLMI